MAVLFAWNERPKEKISLENLRLATELPDAELRRTLWVPKQTKQNKKKFSITKFVKQFLVVGRFSKTQEAIINMPPGSAVSKGFYRKHCVCC